jgi:hypothetical protein
MEITGSIGRNSGTLSISYVLSGPLDELILPAPAGTPVRKSRLWEETCFEFFPGLKSSERYWEFNLSPAGHWNVYSFTSYRQGMREEPAFASLRFSVQRSPKSLLLSVTLGLEKFMPREEVPETIRVALSAVVRTIGGDTTYWALAHPGPQADFHHKDGFIIEL